MKLLNRLITDIKGYYDTEGNKKLSQSFNDDVCQCAEICILAQAYFQKYGFDTKYFDSELLRSKDEEFGEADSFISMRTDKDDYSYNPANPMPYNGMFLPRISSIEATQVQKQVCIMDMVMGLIFFRHLLFQKIIFSNQFLM